MTKKNNSIANTVAKQILPALAAVGGGYLGYEFGSDADNLESIGASLRGHQTLSHQPDVIMERLPSLIDTGESPKKVKQLLESYVDNGGVFDKNVYNDWIYNNWKNLAQHGYAPQDWFFKDDAEYGEKFTKFMNEAAGAVIDGDKNNEKYSFFPDLTGTQPQVNQEAYNAWKSSLSDELRKMNSTFRFVHHPALKYGLAAAGAAGGFGMGYLAGSMIPLNEPAVKKDRPSRVVVYPSAVPARSFSRVVVYDGFPSRNFSFKKTLSSLLLSAFLAMSPQQKAKAAEAPDFSAYPEYVQTLVEQSGLTPEEKSALAKNICAVAKWHGGVEKELEDAYSPVKTVEQMKKAPFANADYSVLEKTFFDPECIEAARNTKDDSDKVKMARSLINIALISGMGKTLNKGMNPATAVSEDADPEVLRQKKQDADPGYRAERDRKLKELGAKMYPNATFDVADDDEKFLDTLIKVGMDPRLSPGIRGLAARNRFKEFDEEDPDKSDPNLFYGPTKMFIKKDSENDALFHEGAHAASMKRGSKQFPHFNLNSWDAYWKNPERVSTKAHRYLMDKLDMSDYDRYVQQRHEQSYGDLAALGSMQLTEVQAREGMIKGIKDLGEFSLNNPELVAQYAKALKDADKEAKAIAREQEHTINAINPQFLKPEHRKYEKIKEKKLRANEQALDILKDDD